jgi:hypothetical protein
LAWLKILAVRTSWEKVERLTVCCSIWCVDTRLPFEQRFHLSDRDSTPPSRNIQSSEGRRHTEQPHTISAVSNFCFQWFCKLWTYCISSFGHAVLVELFVQHQVKWHIRDTHRCQLCAAGSNKCNDEEGEFHFVLVREWPKKQISENDLDM